MKTQHIRNWLISSIIYTVGSLGSVEAAPPSNYSWKTVISDDFNSFNTNVWGSGSTPWGPETNDNCSLITAADTYINNGALDLRCRKGPFTGAVGTYPYSSGWAWTKQRLSYGYIEIRAQYPNHKGAWPAFWMLKDGWPPEFDIAEFRGAPRNYMTMALCDNSQTWNTTTHTSTFTGWRTYALDWQPGYMAFYIDGVVYKTIVGPSVPSDPMYVILSNGTDCRDSDGTGFPNYFKIDYFRWYQRGVGKELADGTYSIRNRDSGKMLDNLGSTADGATVAQWGDNPSNNQNWSVSTSGSFRKLACLNGGKSLDSLHNKLAGTAVGLWTTNAHPNQSWAIRDAGNGFFYIINAVTGMFLNSNGSYADGAFMQFDEGGSRARFQWQFVAP